MVRFIQNFSLLIRLENGEILTEYEEEYEDVPEVITHKHVLDEYNSKASITAKAGMLGDTVQQKGDTGEGEDEEAEKETLTEDEKRGE